jgi:hypothetical protein
MPQQKMIAGVAEMLKHFGHWVIQGGRPDFDTLDGFR